MAVTLENGWTQTKTGACDVISFCVRPFFFRSRNSLKTFTKYLKQIEVVSKEIWATSPAEGMLEWRRWTIPLVMLIDIHQNQVRSDKSSDTPAQIFQIQIIKYNTSAEQLKPELQHLSLGLDINQLTYTAVYV